MRVELWLDFVCPYSYIGKQLFEKALEDFSHRDHVHITYRSYVLYDHSLRIQPSQIVDRLFADWNCKNREERFKQLHTCAQSFGLDKDCFQEKQPINTLHAHRIVKYARTKNKEKQMIDRILHAHFFQGIPIDNVECLQTLATEIGLEKHEVHNILHSCKYTKNVQCDTAEAHDLGAEHIPFIVLNETCGIPTFHTKEQYVYILDECWDESAEHILNKQHKPTTYCSADGCTQM